MCSERSTTNLSSIALITVLVVIMVAALSPKQAFLLRSPKTTLSPFQVSVYTALCRVPEGSVTTYKHLATAIHCQSSQAVGQALRRNPHAPVIPCHRVVASNRTIGGFGGDRKGDKIDKKRRLLEREGVRFDSDGLVKQSCVYEFSEDRDGKQRVKDRKPN